MKKAIVLLIACMISGALLANHWESEHPGNYQYVMGLTSVIYIDGVEQASGQLEVGAFCNGECRGSRMAEEFPLTHRYILFLSVDGVEGDPITFKLYDHGAGQELDLESPAAVTFTNDGYGNPVNPYVLDFASAHTFSLPVAGYGATDGGYRLIAPPFDGVNPETVPGMTQGEYDLYRFDQSVENEWCNYKFTPFSLETGKGYLYAHQTDVTLNFTGAPYSGSGQVVLAKTDGARFSGWNLVGNPFAQSSTVDRDCYVMNAGGTEIIASGSRTVSPMQGIFVIAASDGESMSFSTGSVIEPQSGLVVDLLPGRGATANAAEPGTVDRAIVRFGGGGTLPKFMLNPGNTRLYIPGGGTDYAVAGCSADNATPLSFKASRNGSYTLSFEVVNLSLDYLHLIDNKTGADVDLLALRRAKSPVEYTFEAFTTDYAERFRLEYVQSPGDGGDRPFAYYSDGEIRLYEGECGALLQVVDVLGRVAVTRVGDAMRCVSTAGMASGFYTLRLVSGDSVRVQKIVVN